MRLDQSLTVYRNCGVVLVRDVCDAVHKKKEKKRKKEKKKQTEQTLSLIHI